MKVIKKICIFIISIPKTVYFNFHYFELKKAIRLPIFVSYKVKLKKMGDRGSLKCPDRFMSIKLGFSDGSFDMGNSKKSCFYQDGNSLIEFEGNATLCNPFFITVNKGSNLKFGKNLKSNTNLVLSCDKKISIGDDVLIGWNVTIIDGDGHPIYFNGSKEPYNYAREIIIQNKVWISSNVIILKGTNILKESVISSGATVCSEFKEENVIIGGMPAKIIKNNISWEENWK